MKQSIINQIVQEMLPYLNNAQTEKLRDVIQYALFPFEITEKEQVEHDKEQQDYVELFLSAKRIEGCSEKSLKY